MPAPTLQPDARTPVNHSVISPVTNLLTDSDPEVVLSFSRLVLCQIGQQIAAAGCQFPV